MRFDTSAVETATIRGAATASSIDMSKSITFMICATTGAM